MNAYSISGIWEELLPNNMLIRVDTTRNPERVWVKQGVKSVHFDFPDGVRISDIITLKRNYLNGK
jgi:hypothetical protein